MSKLYYFFISCATSLLMCCAVTACKQNNEVVIRESQEPSFSPTPYEKIAVLHERRAFDRALVIEVENLTGSVFVEQGSDDSVDIRAEVHAIHAKEEVAQALVKKPQLVTKQNGEKLSFHMSYPLKEYHYFYYPSYRQKAIVTEGLKRFTCEYDNMPVTFVRSPLPATIHLFTNIHVSVPRGCRIKVRNAVGTVHTAHLAGVQHVHTGQADVWVSRAEGSVSVVTDVGDVAISLSTGRITSRTKVGNIRLYRCSGSCSLRSVGGDLGISDSALVQATLQTSGRGSIKISSTKARIAAQADSGDVTAEALQADEVVAVRTGSGNIILTGDFAACREIVAESGSGNISMQLNPFPRLVYECYSGKATFSFQVPDFQVIKSGPKKAVGRFLGESEGKAYLRSQYGSVSLSK